jgi:hypothetical protein
LKISAAAVKNLKELALFGTTQLGRIANLLQVC